MTENKKNTEEPIDILIVEDSPTQAEELRYLLEKHNYRVTVAENGRQALELLEKHKPQLVITDIVMPEMDGYELCRQIKAEISMENIPVILLTSLSNSVDVIEGLSCGADNFITKPYNENYLLPSIEQIIANRKLIGSERVRVGVEIYFAGKRRFITADQQQMLSLLLSTYEAAVNKNSELIKTQNELHLLNEHLEIKVAKRTAELTAEIDERKRIEEKLKESHDSLEERVKERTNNLAIAREEASRANKAKSAFLANMSHELRTPLNSINGFSEVLYDETFGPLNEKQKKYVNNVLISGKHLLSLINQILDMAKVESGKMNLSLSSLPMKSLLNNISMLVVDMVTKNKIEMLLEIAEDLPNIEADDLKVKEIIYNLLSNAVKFTPEGGKIGMRANKAGSEIEVVIWDTGIGIAPENMEKIFEGFFRADAPYSRVTEGTGLGLPLSKNLVELHGGKFSVESKGLNRGTSVRFTLPIVSGNKS